MAHLRTPRDFPRPRLVLSKCLEVDACRYNGQMIRSSPVRMLEPHVEFLPICPEVEVGLGVPRAPIRLVRIGEATHLVQPSSGLDLTERMDRFSIDFLEGLEEIDGFVLKSRSPSCGIDGIKVFGAEEGAGPVDERPGLFAASVLERFPDTPVEHEARLTKHGIRDHFLTRVFALAELRTVLARRRMAALVDFHARQKLTLMAHSPGLQRSLGRIVANAEGCEIADILSAYADGFGRALSRRPSRGTHVNVLQHAQGYFKQRLSPHEKARFSRLQGEYRDGRVGRGRLLAMLQSWVDRFDEPYLAIQSYLEPYPRELLYPPDPGASDQP